MAEVVLIHGAWHGAWCWDGVVDELGRSGVTVTAVELPFTGFDDDTAAARGAVEAAGPGAVVCAHSYGGVVVDKAVAALDGIGRVIYLAAFINTAEDFLAGESVPLTEAIVADGERCHIEPSRAHELFYADSDAAEVAQRVVPRLRPMRLDFPAFFADPPPRPDAPTTYVVCSADRAVPPAAQRRMAARCDGSLEWPTDHSPFLTRPAELAALLASHL